MGTGQECLDAAQINSVTALDAADDAALDDLILFLGFFELIEEFHALRSVAGQSDRAFHFVLVNDEDIDLVAYFNGQFTVEVLKF